MATPTRILIARGDALGDLILSTVLIAPLKAAYPNCEIYYLASGMMFKAIENHPEVSGVIIDHMPYSLRIKDIPRLFKQAKTLKEYHFDIFIGAWRVARYAWLARLAGIPIRVGHPFSWSNRLLYTHLSTHKFNDRRIHHTQDNLHLLNALGVPCSSLSPSTLAPHPSTGPSSPKIAIHLESGNPQKTLLSTDFVRLVDTLLSWIRDGKYGLERHTQLVLLGRNESRQAADDILAATHYHPLVINKVDQLCLQQLQAMISSSRLFIGADSGLAHMAAAYNVPSVVTFINKNQNVLEWGPWQSPHRIVMSQHQCPLVCRSGDCRLLTCREGVHIDRVLHEVRALLSDSDPHIPAPSYWIPFGYRVLIVRDGVHNEREMIQHLDERGIQYWVLDTTAALSEIVSLLITYNISVVCSAPPARSLKWRLALWKAGNGMHWPPQCIDYHQLDTYIQGGVI